MLSHSVVSDSLRPHELQHYRLTHPSLSPGVCSDLCPFSQWCHSTISPSVVPFSSCPQSFPAWVFSNESALHIKWPNYWSFSISISNEYSRLISLRIDWFDILAVQIILCTVRTCVLSTTCLQTPVWLTPWNIIVFWVSCHYCLFMKCP